MAYTETRLSNAARPLAALGLLISLGTTACGSFTQTTSTVRSLPEAPIQRLRLSREGISALSGDFHQEGHAIVGQLSLGDDCAEETNQLIRRQQVTQTLPNKKTGTAWAVVGGVLTAVGAGIMLASQNADHHVFCGDGTTVRAGDQCNSESSAALDVGLTTAAFGVGAMILGGVNLARKPQTETIDLTSQQLTHVTAPVSCGARATLEGLSVSLQLPGGGNWTGLAAADGSLRIEINPQLSLPEHETVPLVVDAVPPSLAGLVSPGTVISQLTLDSGHSESAHHRVAIRR